MPKQVPIYAASLRPIRNNLFVSDLDSGPKITYAGIIIPDDNMTERGIRDRWGKVYAAGPDVDAEIQPGKWVLVKHGRWTPPIELTTPDGVLRLWRVDYPESVLLITDEDPREKKHVF